MLLNASIALRPAAAADWPAIEALLRAHQLPTEGAREHLATTLLATQGSEVVGCAGAEVYGSVALLRSVAVAPGLHRQGIGRLLVERLLHEARARDIATLYLLTVTAPEYFAQFGFKRRKMDEAPAALKASAEFQGACPACAALMSLTLREAPAVDPGLPVAVLGAGPVGLAAVAQLLERGLPVVALEAGASVGANLLDYGHVQLFSPWQFNVDPAMARQLAPTGWQAPPAGGLPRAADVVTQVLQPFAALPAVAEVLRLGARVTAISREGLDKVKSAGREQAAFLVQYTQGGEARTLRARAVIDATGTWNQPNPLGASGLPAQGEAEAAAQVFYGIPDVAGALRSRYAGKHTLVVGAGHSAANALLALAELAAAAPGTRLAWAVRSASLQRVFGGGSADALPARGALGAALRRLRDSGTLAFHGGLRITRLERVGAQLRVSGLDTRQQPVVIEGIDEIICATGQRPDLQLASELRLRLDPALESTEALGPLIDPNVHSCGTVRPHGHRELAHPEPGFYTVGVKSYGRAPTFLMATGFEQARSVVAAIAGDLAAADRVELELPETGVCSTDRGDEAEAGGGPSRCCGAAPTAAAATAVAVALPAPPATAARASRCCG
ncbi:MAG: GNAT family N-acetyltransferase [Pelomonas sp.]|nr:GNAT family N-acetyltransferase [Roseateles sp.]